MTKAATTVMKFAVCLLTIMVLTAPGNAATKHAVATGNWSATATWGGSLPATGDDIIIDASKTVTIDVSFSGASLTVSSGAGLVFDNTGASRTLTFSGNVTISSSGVFTSQNSGSASTVHQLTIGGNLLVNGQLNLNQNTVKGYCNLTFNNTSTSSPQTLSGSGPVCYLRQVTLDKGSVGSTLLATRDVTMVGQAILFTNGTWEQNAGKLTNNVTQYVPATGALLFSGSGSLEKASYSVNVNGGNLDVNTSGILRIGYNTRSNVALGITSGTLGIHQGSVNIQGQLVLAGGLTTIDGGGVNIYPQAVPGWNLPAASNAFEISGMANLAWSAGTIVIVDPIEGTGTGREVSITSSGTLSVTGSAALQLGDGSSTKSGADGFEMYVSASNFAFNNLTLSTMASSSVNYQNRDARLQSDITVNGALVINSGKLWTGKTTSSPSDWWTVYLGSLASVTETTGYEVWGQLQEMPNVTSIPFSFNGIGISVTAGPALGNTTVLRKTGFASTGLGNSSILRYFDISPSNNTSLNATLVMSYDNSLEIPGGQVEANLRMYKSTDAGGSWTGWPASVPNTTLHNVTLSGISDFSRWTLSDYQNQPIGKTTTSTNLSTSLNPSCSGVSVTFTAIVSPMTGPTGTVQFMDGASSLGSPVTLASGSAQYTTSNLSVASHTITAVYSGDSYYYANTSNAIQQSVTANPSVSGAVTDVKCYGSMDGEIDISVTSGTPGYTYLWSNGAMTQNATGLTAGNYSVVVTDSYGCTTSGSWTVQGPSGALSLNGSVMHDVTCYGGNDGEIDITVGGGWSGYTYLWSNGAQTQNATNLTAGNYSVVVTDAHGCTISGNWTVQGPNGALSLNGNVAHDVTCYGGSDGEIDMTISGGWSGYTYMWSNGAQTQNATNLTAGSYSVVVTDAHGCTMSGSWTVQGPTSGLSLNGNVVHDVTCYGGTDGEIDITVTGGWSGYTYLWSNGAQTQNATSLTAGSYSVVVTDAHGCTTSGSWTIQGPNSGLTLNGSVMHDVTCYGGTDGEIDITVGGGWSGYTYLWSNGAQTQNATNLTAGNYSVVVTDAHGCTISGNWTVQGPNGALSLNGNVAHDVTCYGGSDGEIDITISGGWSGYTYMWSNGAQTQNATNLTADSYSVVVTDAHGCTMSGSWTVQGPTSGLSLNGNVVHDVTCYGGTDGEIDITVTGGWSGYTYLWSNGAQTQNATSLTAGSYSVVVTDANGCTTSGSWTIQGPNSGLTLNGSVMHDVTCYGGTDGEIDITAGGGWSGYTYLWSNSSTTQNATNLTAGNYSVVVTDAHGCTMSGSWTVQGPNGALTIGGQSTHDVTCYGGTDGEIDITVTGGWTGYTYLWSNGAQTQNATSLTAGSYSVVVTDAHGCTTSGSWTIQGPNSAISLSGNVVHDVTCYGGTDGEIDITVSGGWSGYTYLWSNGAQTQNATSLTAGSYSVVVTDANGCTTSGSWTIQGPTDALSLNGNVAHDVICYGGTDGEIDITVSGGWGGYTYLWSNSSTMQNATNLTAGNYSVVVTDAHGCTMSGSWTVQGPNGMLTLNGNVAHTVTCYGGNDGEIDVSVSGGWGGYTYLWSSGATTQNAMNLSAGYYEIVVTDSHGCTLFGGGFTVDGPTSALTLNGNVVKDVTCYGGGDGEIDLTVSGGWSGYTYLWSNGAQTQNATNLTAGSYSVVVTDAHGCTTSGSWTVQGPNGSLTLNGATVHNVTCYGGTDGEIDITVSGGWSGYTYLWSNGATTQNAAGLSASSYTVVITDSHGCTVGGSWDVQGPNSSLTVDGNVVHNVTCYGGNDGEIDITSSGGWNGYSYLWSNGASTENITTLTSGTYTVVLTDAGGCTTSGSWTVTDPGPLVLSAVNPPVMNVDSVAAGFTLTLTGTGFTSGAQVLFDGDDVTTVYYATVTVVSNTEITVDVPYYGGYALINSIGDHNIVVSDLLCSSTSSAATFTITPGAGTILAFEDPPITPGTFPAGSYLGQPIGGSPHPTWPVVEIDEQDSWGNTLISSGTSITMSLIGPSSQYGDVYSNISGGLTVTTTLGRAFFYELWIDKAGTDKILYADATGHTQAVSQEFTITGGNPDHLTFATQPGSANAGSAFGQQPVVQVVDQWNNATSFASATTCSIAIQTGPSPLPSLDGTTSGISFDGNGQATFTDLQINKAWSGYVLRASASASGIGTGDSDPFDVGPGPAYKLFIATQPHDAQSGYTVGPIGVQLRDQWDNDVFTNNIPIHMDVYSGPGGWAYGPDPADVDENTVNGLATFDPIEFNYIGDYSMIATSSGLMDAITNSFNISAGDPDHLYWSNPPSTTPAGDYMSPSVTLERRDWADNLIPSAGFPVVLTITSGPGYMYDDMSGGSSPSGPPIYALTDATGVASFDYLYCDFVGNYEVSATDATMPPSSTQPVDPEGFTIVTGPPASVAFSPNSIASPTTAGVVFATDITTQLYDIMANPTIDDGYPISIGLGYGTGTISGTTTQMTAGGIATFNDLWINKSGTKYFELSSPALAGGTSGIFDIVHNSATKLGFTNQPARTVHDEQITDALNSSGNPIYVELEDQYGNNVDQNGSTIGISLYTGSGLYGTTSANTDATGTATFGNLRISNVGWYRLVASTSGLTNALSSQFRINLTPKEDEQEVVTIPKSYVLRQNFPNPFNPTTTIEYSLPEAGNIHLTVHDLLGKEIATLVNGYFEAGVYTIQFDGSSLSSGIYIYKLQAEGSTSGKQFIESRQMILMK